jgi:hypothetical protein
MAVTPRYLTFGVLVLLACPAVPAAPPAAIAPAGDALTAAAASAASPARTASAARDALRRTSKLRFAPNEDDPWTDSSRRGRPLRPPTGASGP